MPAPQTILLFIGIAAFVVSAVLLGIAVRTYFALDIRGVTADLAGKARSRDSRTGAGRRGFQRRRTSSSTMRRSANDDFEMHSTDNIENEDDVETAIDESPSPRKVAVNSVLPKSGFDKNDETPTTVDQRVADRDDETPTTVDEQIAVNDGDDTSTIVFGEEDHESIEDNNELTLKRLSSEAKSPRFVLVKRIVILHSDEIIAVE